MRLELRDGIYAVGAVERGEDPERFERVLIEPSERLVRASPSLFVAPSEGDGIQFDGGTVVHGPVEARLPCRDARTPVPLRFGLRRHYGHLRTGAPHEVHDLLSHRMEVGGGRPE